MGKTRRNCLGFIRCRKDTLIIQIRSSETSRMHLFVKLFGEITNEGININKSMDNFSCFLDCCRIDDSTGSDFSDRCNIRNGNCLWFPDFNYLAIQIA
jgi:ribosome maturation protein Sdo1